jgi:hypothetical protein
MPDGFWLTVFWGLGLVFIMRVWLGLLLHLYGGLTSQNWLRVSGKIVRSRVKRAFPEIVFAYLVNGTWYTSKTYSFALFHPHAHRVVESYPVHALVQVFYHPLVPGLSVLEPGLPTSALRVLSLLFLGISLLVIVGLWLFAARIF